MNPESSVRDESFQPAEKQQLAEQAEQRNQLYANLEQEFIGGAAPTTPRTLEDYDRLIREAEAAGGVFRPHGNEGLPDENFEGGAIQGATPDWIRILEAIRTQKKDFIATNSATLGTEFDIDPANPDAQRRPIEYLQAKMQVLVDRGLLKTETGRAAQSDGLFAGNRLMVTTPDMQVQLDRLRTEGEALLTSRLTARIDDRLNGKSDKEQGRAFGGELRDLALRGLIELKPPGKKGDAIEIVAVADPKAFELSSVYANYLASRRESLEGTDEFKDGLQAYLQSIQRQLGEIKNQGNQNRGDLFAGRDAERTSEARRKIDELNRAAEQAVDHSRLETARAADGGYAGNIMATQAREANEASDRRLQALKQDQAAYREAGVAMPRPSDSPDVRTDKERRVRDFWQARALGEDRGASEQQVAFNRYQAQLTEVEAAIARTPNSAMREQLRKQLAALEDARDTAIGKMATMQRAVAPEAARDATKQMLGAQSREHSYLTMNATEENFRERAMAKREALGLEALPFFEKRRGPIMEAYFRIPGNNHLVVMERYDRRTGKLLSQNTWSTEQEMTGNFRGSRWRREIADEVDATRDQDRQTARDTSRAGFWRRLRFGVGLGGTQRLDGVRGAYANYATTPAQRNALARHGGGSNAFTYWTTGGRRS